MVGFGVDFDDAAIGEEREVVGGGFVGEAHGVVAAHVDAGGVLVRLALLLAGGRCGLSDGGEAETQN